MQNTLCKKIRDNVLDTGKKDTLPGCKCKHWKNDDHTLAQWDVKDSCCLKTTPPPAASAGHRIKSIAKRHEIVHLMGKLCLCACSIYPIPSDLDPLPGIMCGRVIIIGVLCLCLAGYLFFCWPFSGGNLLLQKVKSFFIW